MTGDGMQFGGEIALREIVSVGTVNGERVADALVELGDDGLLLLPPKYSAKVWVSVDAHGAEPGDYAGKILVQPLLAEAEPIQLDLLIEVANVRMPARFPLTLCTWDYIPNKWFPERAADVLLDMARHGVNVFPRTTPMPAHADE